MNINTGPPVTGSDFYNRNRELQRMDETLRKPGTSIFIPGPRRIGKSSIVKEFMRINEKRMNILYFDLESRKSIIELCTDLAREIKARFPQLIKSNRDLKRVWNTLSQMLPELKIGEVQVKTGQIENQEHDFMRSLENILNILNKEKIILAFDEFFDYLINLVKTGLPGMKLFLEWLRRLRQEKQIQFIITGSVNILSTVEQYNVIGLLNDLTNLCILPLPEENIRELFADLLAGQNIELSEDVLKFCLERLTEGIPFYIQLFADRIYCLGGYGCRITKIAEIEKYYTEIFLLQLSLCWNMKVSTFPICLLKLCKPSKPPAAGKPKNG